MRGILILTVFILSLYKLQAQTDSIPTYKIDEVKIVSAIKPSNSRSGTLLQTITGNDISRIGIISMADAVRRFAGVSVKDYGGIGGLKTVSIRGLGATHTGVSYDGIPINDSQSGQIDLGRFSLDNVSMLTLSIGQSDDIFQPARYSSSAGFLSITTDQPDKVIKKQEGQIKIKTGSFGLFEPSANYIKSFSKNWTAAINGGWQRADGNYPFRFSDGAQEEKRKRINSDTDIWRTEINIYGNLKKAGKLKLKAYYFDSERGLPGPVTFNNPDATERLWNNDFFSQANYEKQISNKFSVKGLTKFTRNYTKYINDNINFFEKNKYTQFEYFLSGIILYKASDFLSLSLAQDYSRSALNMHFKENEDEGALYPAQNKAYRNTFMTAFSAQLKNKNVTATISLLGGYYGEEVEKGNKPDNKKRFSPSASISYKLFETGIRVRTSYKDIYRVPTFNDMYYSNIGNTKLKPEKTKQYNAGLTWVANINETFSFVSFTADAYYNKIKDKIVAKPSMFIWSMMNVDNVTIKGFDMTAMSDIALTDKVKLKLNGTYSFQYAKNDDTGEQIPYIAKHSGGASVGIETPLINISYNLVASSKQQSSLFNAEVNLIKPYTDQSISVNRKFDFSGSSIYLQAELLNFTNKNYEILKNYPMPGQTFRFSTTFNF